MIRGLNVRIDVYRRDEHSPDAIGGAVVTQDLHQADVAARVQPQRTSLMARETGLQVDQLFNIMVWPATVDIIENDVIIPRSGQFAGLQIKVTNANDSGIWPVRPSSPKLICGQHIKPKQVQ